VSNFHPDLRRHTWWMPRDLGLPATLGLQRGLDALAARRRAADVTVVPLDPQVSVRLFRPAGMTGETPALLWIHGGGYVIGRAYQDDRMCREFASTLGITVASVDYRRAPEHPFPAPLDDCRAAFDWLLDQPGVDTTRVAIGGASAGGGLAAALAIRLRDEGAVTPVLQLLSYPMLDDRTTMPAGSSKSDYRWWGARSNRFGWAAYLGDADPGTAVPARLDDLSGLPPAWIGVGTSDLFHDEDIAYAGRLAAAGVPCEVEEVPGAYHGFDITMAGAGVSRRFFDSRCAALRKAFQQNDVDVSSPTI
jgi:acetyl esterase/lipase